MRFAVDTNVLLEWPEIVTQNKCVILAPVLRELEKLKRDREIGHKARRCARFLESANGSLEYDLQDYTFNQNESFNPAYVDNQILQACIENGYGLITEDILLKQKARGFKIPVESIKDKSKEAYKGIKEVKISDEEMARFYETLDQNRYDLYSNQYLIIRDLRGKLADIKRWNGVWHVDLSIKYHEFNSRAIGPYKPKDEYQRCAFDSLAENDFTMLIGGAGSGKTLLSMAYIFAQLQSGAKDKCYIIFNPCAARGTAQIGYRPGDTLDKMLASSLGSMLMTKVGDTKDLDMFFSGDKLIVIPASDMRGLDVKNAILYLPEGQNYNNELMKTAIERVGDGAKLIVEGDVEAQVDSSLYEGINNGMRSAAEVFKGEECFSMVHLANNYRSVISRIAGRM